MKMAILRAYPTFPYMAQVISSFTSTGSLSDPDIHTDVFSEAETDIRYEVSYLQGAGESGVVICGRGSLRWKEVLRRLEATAHFEEGRLARSLSMRLFYNVTATSK